MQSDQYLTPTFQVGPLQCDQLFELRCDVVAIPPLGPTTVPLQSEKNSPGPTSLQKTFCLSGLDNNMVYYPFDEYNIGGIFKYAKCIKMANAGEHKVVSMLSSKG